MWHALDLALLLWGRWSDSPQLLARPCACREGGGDACIATMLSP
jgi:hypothetical protein